MRARALLFASLVLLPVLLLSGCGPKRMRADFIGFEKAYAETSNREVLLNLARLQNHDVTYFFKLGQISSSYRMQANLTGSGQYVIQGTGTGGNAIGGGNPALTFENDPSFTFIPVNDDTSARLLLRPVPAETLYNLYLQGWRVDQLFRLMVDRIELTVPDGKGEGCSVETIKNVPPPARSIQDGVASAAFDRQAAEFATFLRVSALVYWLQQNGHMMLRGTTTFVPVDDQSSLTVSGGGTDAAAPKAGDLASAAAKGQSWRQVGNRWVLGTQVFGVQFYSVESTSQRMRQTDMKSEILSSPDFAAYRDGPTLDRLLGILHTGFSIEEPQSSGGADDACVSARKNKNVTAHLVMRSLLGLMAAASQEQAAFEALKARTEALPSLEGEPSKRFVDSVPGFEQMPALRLKWTDAEERNGPPLVAVNYHGSDYVIADEKVSRYPQNDYWNRDMFRLINQLTAQVTVDISKFPLPGLLQLHSN